VRGEKERRGEEADRVRSSGKRVMAQENLKRRLTAMTRRYQ
jgi:hypothetical protein